MNLLIGIYASTAVGARYARLQTAPTGEKPWKLRLRVSRSHVCEAVGVLCKRASYLRGWKLRLPGRNLGNCAYRQENTVFLV